MHRSSSGIFSIMFVIMQVSLIRDCDWIRKRSISENVRNKYLLRIIGESDKHICLLKHSAEVIYFISWSKSVSKLMIRSGCQSKLINRIFYLSVVQHFILKSFPTARWYKKCGCDDFAIENCRVKTIDSNVCT